MHRVCDTTKYVFGIRYIRNRCTAEISRYTSLLHPNNSRLRWDREITFNWHIARWRISESGQMYFRFEYILGTLCDMPDKYFCLSISVSSSILKYTPYYPTSTIIKLYKFKNAFHSWTNQTWNSEHFNWEFIIFNQQLHSWGKEKEIQWFKDKKVSNEYFAIISAVVAKTG